LIARLLHWLIAALAIGMLAGGSVLSFLPPGGFKSLVVAAHKSTGVLIFPADDRSPPLALLQTSSPVTWGISCC
jgi:hypothetical protein